MILCIIFSNNQYPRFFFCFNTNLYGFSYPLNVVRDSENRIISIDLISLQAALGLLCKLKIISREEIENIFKRTDTTTENPAMFNIRVSVFNVCICTIEKFLSLSFLSLRCGHLDE